MDFIVPSIEKRGTRGSVVIEKLANGMAIEYAVRIEKKIYEAMSIEQLKTVIRSAGEELTRRATKR